MDGGDGSTRPGGRRPPRLLRGTAPLPAHGRVPAGLQASPLAQQVVALDDETLWVAHGAAISAVRVGQAMPAARRSRHGETSLP